MSEEEWFNAALDIRYEVANRVESLGFEHVKVNHNFITMRDSMDYDIYFCSNDGRQRITVSLPGDSTDVDSLMRQFQDQLFSKFKN